MDALFCYHIVLMLVATTAFIFLWIGFSTPGWLVVSFQEAQARNEYTVSSLNRSLFYDIHCPQELKDCKTCRAGDTSARCVADFGFQQYSQHFTWIEQLTSETEEWLGWQVIMCVVVGFCSIGFILVLCLVCCIFRTWTYRVIATTGFFLWLIAGLLVWVPVGMDAHMHVQIENKVDNDVMHDATLHIPYSIILVAIGGFLALITAFMLLWLTGVCGRREYSSYSGSEYSKEGPMVIAPRYYEPQPYYVPERHIAYGSPQGYYPRAGSVEEVIVDDFPHYKGISGGWAPNRWYDNRSAL